MSELKFDNTCPVCEKNSGCAEAGDGTEHECENCDAELVAVEYMDGTLVFHRRDDVEEEEVESEDDDDDLAHRIRGALAGQNCLRADVDYDAVLGIIVEQIEKSRSA